MGWIVAVWMIVIFIVLKRIHDDVAMIRKRVVRATSRDAGRARIAAWAESNEALLDEVEEDMAAEKKDGQ